MKIATLKKQIQWLMATRPLPLQKPEVIQFPVIDICNSRCQMCRIWENKKSRDITVEQLAKGLDDALFSEVRSIGFNGGEPTLRKDLPDLVAVVVKKLPKLKSVSLITNAYKSEEVIAQVELIGGILKSAGIAFDVMVSLDGYQSVHDRVRGRAGNFARALRVLEHLKTSAVVDSIRIGCTVIKENVNELPALLDFCIVNDLYVKFRLGVPHQRLYTDGLQEPYALTFEEKYEFVEFLEGLIKYYEPNIMQRFFYRSLADQIIRGEPRRAGCPWQHKGVTITSRGELAYCAVKSKVLMSNIAEGNAESAYFGNEDHLRQIVDNECSNCHHDYNGIPSRSDYRELLFARIVQRTKLKQHLLKIPGVPTFKKIRDRRRFSTLLSNYRNISSRIKSVDADAHGERPRILICGWYGTETLGDKAIIGGVLRTLEAHFGRDEADVFVGSLNPYITEMTGRQMCEFRRVTILDMEEALAIVATMDHLIFGGGPLMAINDLAFIEALFDKAKAAGVNRIVSGAGVGPLGDAWLNDSIRRILSQSCTRIYRDEASLELANKLGVCTKNDIVAEDPAFTWLAQVPKKVVARERKVLLLGLRDFPYRQYAPELTEQEALKIKKGFEEAIKDALVRLVSEDKSLLIRPIPMCTNHFGSDDRWYYRSLFREMDGLVSNVDYALLGPERSPAEYAEFFNDADALLAMRYHSLVFGLALGVNCVALDYTMGRGKVKALADKHNVPTITMRETSGQRIFEKLRSAINKPQRPRLADDSLLFKRAMTDCFQSASERASERSLPV